MIVKGIVSAIYAEEKKLSVILPEHDNITTNPLPIYGNPDMDDYAVNDFVMVVAFNNDFTDGMVLAESSVSEGGSGGGYGFYSLEVDEDGNLWANYVDGDSPPPFEYDAETGDLYFEV